MRYDASAASGKAIDPLPFKVDMMTVCPEVECGLGVPREAMRLVGNPDSARLLTLRSEKDHTQKMTSWVKKRTVELEADGLCGFIFKSKSPSSGLEGVKVYHEKGVPLKKGGWHICSHLHGAFPLASR